MTKPKALYFHKSSYRQANLSHAREHFDLLMYSDTRFASVGISADILREIEIFFSPPRVFIDKGLLDSLPNLKIIVSNTTSLDHIDMGEVGKRLIAVCSLENETEFLETITPTAEHTIGLMMALHRRILAAHQDVMLGKWDRRRWPAPAMLSRLRLGIMGRGRVGRRVEKIARAVGMTVSCNDTKLSLSQVTLEGLLSYSDIFTIHTPILNRPIGLDELKLLPKGALVINTSRGANLNISAVVNLMKGGHIRGCAVDVVDPMHFENSEVRSYIRASDSFIVTPHIAGSTEDAWYETERFVIDKAINVWRGMQ